ncbi:hypothetical protein HanIR_Chr04g0154061 [Helianthus annuus]|nr:hypothetical protein HanIR_Chr04g0154061 [Helianthus annuus]
MLFEYRSTSLSNTPDCLFFEYKTLPPLILPTLLLEICENNIFHKICYKTLPSLTRTLHVRVA